MVDPTLVPANKFDIKAVNHLSTVPPPQWQSLIPDLLTWLQDPHWPIFTPVRDLLLLNTAGCVEPLIEVYQGGDTEWQYWTLRELVSAMAVERQRELVPVLRELRGRVMDESDDGDGWRKGDVDEEIDRLLSERGHRAT